MADLADKENHNIIQKLSTHTWNTVNSDGQKESKLLRGFSSSSKLKRPPKSCIPRSEKMMMKRNKSNNKLAMERMEFRREATRLRSEAQYL